MTVPQHDMKWRKSTRSDQQGACVEVSPLGAVRDSKNPAGPILEVGFAGLIAAVKADRLA